MAHLLRTAAVLLCMVACLPATGTGQTPNPSPSVANDFMTAEPAEQLPEPAAAGLAGLKASALAAHIRLLASPALEGRGLASRGLDAAAEYVAAALALAGVAPLGSSGAAPEGSSYFQEPGVDRTVVPELRAPPGMAPLHRR